ncbi:MAG: Na+/H+ antiporter NhaA [Bacteroidota bacterium]|nr:Na+/H+ antiporter NhaA [Bacteroidota bacterium]
MKITKLFTDFFNSEKIGGILLLICTAISLIIANSIWGNSYDHFWHSYIDLSFLNIDLKYSIQHWINDGLMTVFFLLVGLEIEREIYKGELSDFRNALLPIAAAIGGMVIPAAIHFYFNNGTVTQSGFGIPMATDIAFALGMLALVGSRIPFSLKVFLTALAIIDDLGAIMIIAIFYNDGIAWAYLGAALGIFGLLMFLNKAGIKNLLFYLLPGVLMWYCMLQSGVHATITGVLLAFAIPFGKNDKTNPSYILQHALHKPVAFLILPVFALANTGIVLTPYWYYNLASPNSIGIILGLLIGKPLGILLFCWLLLKLQWAKLPEQVNWKMILGASVLAGIGFTMSIFISNLAFDDKGFTEFSKVAVLVVSLLAALIGLAILFTGKKIQENDT